MHRPEKCLLLLFGISATLFFGCSKDKGLAAEALLGRWQYQNSTFDTSRTGRSVVTVYDLSFVADMAETLEFKKGDTVTYTYKGLTTWSNYKVSANQLVLIGSANRVTVNIYTLTSNQLVIGWDSPAYKASFVRQ